MAKKQKQEEEIKTDLWKDTFSDLMNLLLCFFVLLYSMSNVDEVKYAELVASLSNSFSIFNGGAQAIGQGQLISSGATQLNNLDEYFNDMGKQAEEIEDADDPTAEIEKKRADDAKKLYGDVVTKAENNRVQDSVDITIDDGNQYVMLSLSGGILFDSGSADIRSGAKPILSRVGTILKSYPNRRIKIEGHTDDVPINSTEYPSNLWLSTARATKVYEYFINTKKLRAKNMEASGRSEFDPIASNDTAKGRAKNRRVEIKIYTDID